MQEEFVVRLLWSLSVEPEPPVLRVAALAASLAANRAKGPAWPGTAAVDWTLTAAGGPLGVTSGHRPQGWDSTATPYLCACRAAVALGLCREAVAWAREATRHVSDDRSAWSARVHLGIACLAAGENAIAMAVLDDCHPAPEPADPVGIVHLAAGRCHEARGEHQAALAAYARAAAVQFGGDPGLAVHAEQGKARLLLFAGAWAEAGRALDGAAAYLGDATPADRTHQLALRALLLWAAEQAEQAMPLCETVLWRRPPADDWDRAAAARTAAAALPSGPWQKALRANARRWAAAAGDPLLSALVVARGDRWPADVLARAGLRGGRPPRRRG